MRIVIAAAGMGSRLGLSVPKCLASIEGKPLIQWQLEALAGLGDIVVVTGFKHELVAAELDGVRVVVNHNYASTTVVDSVRLGVGDFVGDVFIIDGDVLFTRDDIERVVAAPGDVVCVTGNISTSNPVFVEIESDHVVRFTRDRTQLEWAGICKASSEYLRHATGFMYETLADHLPMRWLLIDSIEIDTPEDLSEAIKWSQRIR